MKKLLKNKRGMVMESAVVFMLLTFTLSLLMTGAVMIMHLRVQISDKTIQREITLEQIGEKFVAGELTNGQVIDGKYVININDDKTILDLTNGVNTVLYIKIEGGKVAKWQYSKPTE